MYFQSSESVIGKTYSQEKFAQQFQQQKKTMGEEIELEKI